MHGFYNVIDIRLMQDGLSRTKNLKENVEKKAGFVKRRFQNGYANIVRMDSPIFSKVGFRIVLGILT